MYDAAFEFIERGFCFADMFIADQITNAAESYSPEFSRAAMYDAMRYGYIWGSH